MAHSTLGLTDPFKQTRYEASGKIHGSVRWPLRLAKKRANSIKQAIIGVRSSITATVSH